MPMVQCKPRISLIRNRIDRSALLCFATGAGEGSGGRETSGLDYELRCTARLTARLDRFAIGPQVVTCPTTAS